MTSEHLRPLLDDWSSMQVLVKAAEMFADGGARGTVAGDVFRRFVARTMAHQLGQAVRKATSPHQYALSTRAGCECIAHALQRLTDHGVEHELERGPKFATSWNASREWRIPELLFRSGRGSKCWGLHWVMTTLSPSI